MKEWWEAWQQSEEQRKWTRIYKKDDFEILYNRGSGALKFYYGPPPTTTVEQDAGYESVPWPEKVVPLQDVMDALEEVAQ